MFGDKMKVKVIHERDLEQSINEFISKNPNVVDIKFQVAIGISGEEQIYCFSALIIYEEKA